MKKILKWIGALSLVILVAVAAFYFIYVRPFLQHMNQTTEVQVDKNLTLVLGGGGNSGIFSADNLVVVIDTKQDEAAEKLAEQVKQLAGNKPILVINTHFHPDHTKGNPLYKGQQIMAGGNYSKDFWVKENKEDGLPTIWLKKDTNIVMGEDTLTVFGLNRNIHTASDLFVYSHKRKMLFGGDVILNQQAPAILGAADPYGYIQAFEKLPKKFDIKTVVPGHGPIGGIEVIENFKQYFNDMILAAANESMKDKMIEKYNNWAQIPFFMCPEATIKAFQKQMKNN